MSERPTDIAGNETHEAGESDDLGFIEAVIVATPWGFLLWVVVCITIGALIGKSLKWLISP